MTSARLRVAPDIVRRLGEELNPTMDKGVLELVKNAYDADATSCRIELQNTDKPGGRIIVEDDGDGMTPNQIRDKWLVLGRSSKSTSELTRLGRIPAGSKGLGRLASLRMGTSAYLYTSPKSNTASRYKLEINWPEFDEVDTIDKYLLEIESKSLTKSRRHGTRIVIEDLTSSLGRTPVKRLAREIIMLADPFGDNPIGFKPELLVSEYEDLEALVRNRYFEEAELHLHAEIQENGEAIAQVTDWRGEVLFEAQQERLTRNIDSEFECQGINFDFWVFILNQEAFLTRKSTIQEVRDWLSEFGGVHFYYNNLRVSPYGNPGDDWLGINLRRAQSPEVRPSTNTSIGRVTVLDRSDALVQKTDRSGFIEGQELIQIRSFVQNSLEWMAARRLDEAEKRRSAAKKISQQRSTGAKQKIETAISNIPSKDRMPLETAFKSYESARKREVNVLQREVQLYRTLSTVGITAATFAHESSGNPLDIISRSLSAIKRRVKKLLKVEYETMLEDPIDRAVRAVKSLSVLSTTALNLVNHEKRRRGRVELHDVIIEVVGTYEYFLDGRDVHVHTHLAPGDPYLRAQRAAIESILANLLNNSICAFENAEVRDRSIEITTEIVERQWSMSVSDNGPGIEGISKSDIWLPGRTTQKNGTGLGLTIVRDATNDLGGHVDAIENGHLGGATITIELPILGC